MDESSEKDHELIEANWLTNWEDQCVREIENDTNMDERIQMANEQSGQKLWLSFQNSATAIAQLYRDKSDTDTVSLWVPFQNAAGGVTTLYKDSMDVMKKSFELGVACAHHRRTRDVLSWAKKRRRHIRREDLIAYLCGKSPPVRTRPPPPALGWAPTKVSVVERASPRLPSVVETREDGDEITDLQPFRDALALQCLNGAMSNISMGFPADAGGGATGAGGGGGAGATGGTGAPDDDFHCFILDEMSRRCDSSRKRTPTNDVIMDSPTRKRSRLL